MLYFMLQNRTYRCFKPVVPTDLNNQSLIEKPQTLKPGDQMCYSANWYLGCRKTNYCCKSIFPCGGTNKVLNGPIKTKKKNNHTSVSHSWLLTFRYWKYRSTHVTIIRRHFILLLLLFLYFIFLSFGSLCLDSCSPSSSRQDVVYTLHVLTLRRLTFHWIAPSAGLHRACLCVAHHVM